MCSYLPLQTADFLIPHFASRRARGKLCTNQPPATNWNFPRWPHSDAKNEINLMGVCDVMWGRGLHSSIQELVDELQGKYVNIGRIDVLRTASEHERLLKSLHFGNCHVSVSAGHIIWWTQTMMQADGFTVVHVPTRFVAAFNLFQPTSDTGRYVYAENIENHLPGGARHVPGQKFRKKRHGL